MSTPSVHDLIKEIVQIEKKLIGYYPRHKLEVVRFIIGSVRNEQHVVIDPIRMKLNLKDRGSDLCLTVYANHPELRIDHSKISEAFTIKVLEYARDHFRGKNSPPPFARDTGPVYVFDDDEPSPFSTPGDLFKVSMDWMEWYLESNPECKTFEHAQSVGMALIEDLKNGRQVKVGDIKANPTNRNRIYFHHLVSAKGHTETWEMAHRLAVFQHQRLYSK